MGEKQQSKTEMWKSSQGTNLLSRSKLALKINVENQTKEITNIYGLKAHSFLSPETIY